MSMRILSVKSEHVPLPGLLQVGGRCGHSLVLSSLGPGYWFEKLSIPFL